MTPEELDEARIAEAHRRYAAMGHRTALHALAEVFNEGWTPPPKVDPDLLAAREWAAVEFPDLSIEMRKGDWDLGSTNIRAFLAGAKHGRGS